MFGSIYFGECYFGEPLILIMGALYRINSELFTNNRDLYIPRG